MLRYVNIYKVPYFQEFDNPFILLENKNGFLYKMVQQTGPEMARILTQIAENVRLLKLYLK